MRDILLTIYASDLSGVLLELSGDELVSLTVTDSLRDTGLSIGSCGSKRYAIQTDATKVGFDSALAGHYARVKIFDESFEGAVYSDKTTWRDLGAFYINEVNLSENGAICKIKGFDALSGAFENEFSDSDASYPTTLKNLIDTLCATAGTSIEAGEVFNADLRLRKRPEWQSGTTIRRALGDAAFAAASLVRINYAGEIQIVSASGGDSVNLSADDCTEFALDGSAFCLKHIMYRAPGESEYTRYDADSSVPDASNTLKCENNPILTESVLQSVLKNLNGAGFEGGNVKWRGGEACQAGDVIAYMDLNANAHRLLISELTIKFDENGLRYEAISSMPKPVKGAVGGGAKVFNADGTLNFDLIGGVTSRVAALTEAYINNLSANQIQTNGLLAKFIEALSLRAASIEADEVRTDELSAMCAQIINASISKIEAGTILSDVLTAAIINAVALKVGQLNAASISTDRLASALAAFQVIAAGTANFDRASVTHMVSQALNLTYGAAGEVYIQNLAADYAQMVKANVGNLCVKASDGEFYRLNVDAQTGFVSAERVNVSDSELQNGKTEAGNVIIETQIDASQLNASSVKAVYALINRLDAARIDADVLFASRAFIDRLNTQDITSNSYIRLMLGEFGNRLAQTENALNQTANQQDYADAYIDGLRRYITIDDEGLKQGRFGSVYSTLIDERGFHIKRRGAVESVGRFDSEGLSAHGVKIGEVKARASVGGGWAFE